MASEDHFFCYINTEEKYVEVLGMEENSLALYITDRTLRHGEHIPPDNTPTVVTFPGGFTVEASGGRYAIRVIGVQRPSGAGSEDGDLFYDGEGSTSNEDA